MSNLDYSPIVIGLVSLGILALGLVLFPAAGLPLPPLWVWLAFCAVPIAGATLQIATRRAVYIKALYTSCSAALALVYGVLAYNIIAMGRSIGAQLLVALGLLVVYVAVGWQTWSAVLNAPERTLMPHGPIGKLEERTGIVFIGRSTSLARNYEAKQKAAREWSRRYSLFTAGLVSAAVQLLPADARSHVVLFVACATCALFAVGTGRQMAFLTACMRWERTHGRPIVVK